MAQTDERLREALVATVRDHGYGNATIRQVARRAGVGRSTFYTHFGDLDALHGHALGEFLKRKRGRTQVLGFAGPFFEHAGKQGRAWIGAPGSDERSEVRERLRKTVLGLVREEIAGLHPKLRPAHAEGTARYIAGAFTDLLLWWVDTPNGLSAAEVEAVFLRLTAGALSALR